MMVTKYFSISCNPFTFRGYQLASYYKKKPLFSFFYLLSCLFMIAIHSWIPTLLLKISKIWQVGVTYNRLLCPCHMPHIFVFHYYYFSISLLSGKTVFKLMLYLSWPPLESRHFMKPEQIWHHKLISTLESKIRSQSLLWI